MEQIMNYVKPELIVVAIVLYFVGVGLKKAQAIPDKYIPIILSALSGWLPPARLIPVRILQWLFLQRLCREY